MESLVRFCIYMQRKTFSEGLDIPQTKLTVDKFFHNSKRKNYILFHCFNKFSRGFTQPVLNKVGYRVIKEQNYTFTLG